jgi:uncharacterized protein YyaL (SSP411 family)
MATAFANTYTALKDEKYLNIAKQNGAFLIDKFESDEFIYHTYKDGKRQPATFLDDYAFLIEALLKLFEVTQDIMYLGKSGELTEFILAYFYDETSKYFI